MAPIAELLAAHVDTPAPRECPSLFSCPASGLVPPPAADPLTPPDVTLPPFMPAAADCAHRPEATIVGLDPRLLVLFDPDVLIAPEAWPALAEDHALLRHFCGLSACQCLCGHATLNSCSMRLQLQPHAQLQKRPLARLLPKPATSSAPDTSARARLKPVRMHVQQQALTRRMCVRPRRQHLRILHSAGRACRQLADEFAARWCRPWVAACGDARAPLPARPVRDHAAPRCAPLPRACSRTPCCPQSKLCRCVLWQRRCGGILGSCRGTDVLCFVSLLATVCWILCVWPVCILVPRPKLRCSLSSISYSQAESSEYKMPM